MVQIYIKYTDDNYYLMDLDSSESINFKLTAKDLSDITKIYSPFTQSFKIPATDKNKTLIGFIGNERTLKISTDGVFDARLYISGFLFQTGKLTFSEITYENKEQISFKTTFASNLTGLSSLLGDLTVQDLFKDEVTGEFDAGVSQTYNQFTVKSMMKSIDSNVLTNGITLKHAIPFMSNNRVWVYDESNLSVVDNISFNQIKGVNDNFINTGEVRPCIDYMSIMSHLLLKIGLDVTCPLFDKPEVKDLFVWCSSENTVDTNQTYFLVKGYEPFFYSENGVITPTKWIVTLDGVDGVIKIERNPAVVAPENWGEGIKILLFFNELTSLDGSTAKIKVRLRNSATGVIIGTQEVTLSTASRFELTIIDEFNGSSMLDQNGEIYLTYEILPVTLCKWTDMRVSANQAHTAINFTDLFFHNSLSLNFTPSTELGGNKINLITSLPKLKAADFLKSFFKTFNISVISTGLQDGSMYWLTPDDIKENNLPYSKRIVDYTRYADSSKLTKDVASQYNQYLFSHFDSEYYEALQVDGSTFGSLKYPEIAPEKPVKFEVKTDYSIIKRSEGLGHPDIRTFLGFSRDAPTVLSNGGNRYNPVYEEFTLLYLESKNISSQPVGIEYTETQNIFLDLILEPSYKSSNGKILSFGAINLDTDSLYLNHYREFIEHLLLTNTYESEFDLTLPPNEIFLNFSNTNQGEGNIPTGFRIQNEIVIGEQRYKITDSSIDLTTGRTRLTLLNF